MRKQCVLPNLRVRVHGLYSQLCHWLDLWLWASCLTLFFIQLICEADVVMFKYLRGWFYSYVKGDRMKSAKKICDDANGVALVD